MFSLNAFGESLGMPSELTPAQARLIALYLPQFHPIPENDEWWGKGFTEWTNVAKAKPLYRGHWQPRLPADLGFYDLRIPEVREQQANLARAAGVEGFCYWHYWFGNGRRILERPFAEVLASGRPDFPFSLAWANQTWSGIWHGSPNKILMKQEYPGPSDEQAHFELVLPAFRDHRYITVDGKPIFALLDAGDHPDPPGFIRHWRQLAEQAGLPGLYFIAMWNRGPNPKLSEFDAIAEFGPGDFLQTLPAGRWSQRVRRWKQGEFGPWLRPVFGKRLLKPQRYKYSDVVKAAFTSKFAEDPRYIPTVLPGWDNTPRSAHRGVVFEEATPALFGDYLKKAIALLKRKPAQERIIFLKAWNEWAEGNYVEPDREFGHRYLDAIHGALFPAAS
jgi:lipopolysaccharide biosynthesis protein